MIKGSPFAKLITRVEGLNEVTTPRALPFAFWRKSTSPTANPTAGSLIGGVVPAGIVSVVPFEAAVVVGYALQSRRGSRYESTMASVGRRIFGPAPLAGTT